MSNSTMNTDNISLSKARIEPTRISNITSLNKCQFCSGHHDRTMFVSVDYNIGFICCSNCNEAMELTIEDWNKNKAFGSARIFEGRTIKIRRSDGVIEDNWKLDILESYVRIIDNKEFIVCEQINGHARELVSIDNIFELNADDVLT